MTPTLLEAMFEINFEAIVMVAMVAVTVVARGLGGGKLVALQLETAKRAAQCADFERLAGEV